MENNKQNLQEINDDWMEVLGVGPTTKRLTKEEYEHEKYMDEEINFTIKMSRRQLKQLEALAVFLGEDEDEDEDFKLTSEKIARNCVTEYINQMYHDIKLIADFHKMN